MNTKRALFSLAALILSIIIITIFIEVFQNPKEEKSSLEANALTLDEPNKDKKSYVVSKVFNETTPYDKIITPTRKDETYVKKNQADDESTQGGAASADESMFEAPSKEELLNDFNSINNDPDASTIIENQTDIDDEPSKLEDTNKDAKTDIQEEKSKYSNIGISIAKAYVNIRETASTDSDIIGKLYRDSAVNIISTEGDWYHVESGSVKGYISSAYIKTGLSDEELIKKYGSQQVQVKCDGLNVRIEPDAESDRKTVIYLNETYSVIELLDQWIKINVEDDNVIGYVSREYVDLIINFPKAISKEEEAELLRLKEEERLKDETAIRQRDEVKYSKDELKLLACIVHAEAGNQSYEGKLAVANVVLNRVKSSKYPGTIEKVIYQSGQFTVSTSGSLAKQLSNYDNYESSSQRLSIKAAKSALEGYNNIKGRLHFNSYKSAVKKGYDEKSNAVKLEDHLFW